MKQLLFAMYAVLFILPVAASATPSTQIWIPSTDVQGYGVVHLGVDTYNTLPSKGGNAAPTKDNFNVINYGLTVGVLPGDGNYGVEVGIDYRDLNGITPVVADSPYFYNAKFGIKEGALGEGLPSLAVGGFDFGGKSDVSNSNIMYGLVAKTFGDLGRISAGFYSGNDKVLVDDKGKADNTGLLASWDKTLSEKWWAAVDYMGGQNSYGALSFGVCYYLTPNASFIVGYDIYNNSNLLKPTFTFQLDVNFDATSHAHHPGHE